MGSGRRAPAPDGSGKVIDGVAETVAWPPPDPDADHELKRLNTLAADTAIGARGASGGTLPGTMERAAMRAKLIRD